MVPKGLLQLQVSHLCPKWKQEANLALVLLADFVLYLFKGCPLPFLPETQFPLSQPLGWEVTKEKVIGNSCRSASNLCLSFPSNMSTHKGKRICCAGNGGNRMWVGLSAYGQGGEKWRWQTRRRTCHDDGSHHVSTEARTRFTFEKDYSSCYLEGGLGTGLDQVRGIGSAHPVNWR